MVNKIAINNVLIPSVLQTSQTWLNIKRIRKFVKQTLCFLFIFTTQHIHTLVSCSYINNIYIYIYIYIYVTQIYTYRNKYSQLKLKYGEQKQSRNLSIKFSRLNQEEKSNNINQYNTKIT